MAFDAEDPRTPPTRRQVVEALAAVLEEIPIAHVGLRIVPDGASPTAPIATNRMARMARVIGMAGMSPMALDAL